MKRKISMCFTAVLLVVSLLFVFTISSSAVTFDDTATFKIIGPESPGVFTITDTIYGYSTVIDSSHISTYYESYLSILNKDFTISEVDFSYYIHDEGIIVSDSYVVNGMFTSYFESHGSITDYDISSVVFYFLIGSSSDISLSGNVITNFENIDCTTEKIWEGWLTNGPVLGYSYLYKCYADLSNFVFNDGRPSRFNINYSLMGYSNSSGNSTIFVGMPLFTGGFYIDGQDVPFETELVLPPFDNSSLNDVKDKNALASSKLDLPAPDIDQAVDNINSNQMSAISSFFVTDSKFYIFLTSLMVVGVSFGLIGYVLHGKK